MASTESPGDRRLPMPELPEVEAARRLLLKTMRGKKIASVQTANDPIVFERESARRFSSVLAGRTVKGAGRRGKYLWLELDRRPWPLIHFGLSGRIEVVEADDNVKFAKLSLRLHDGRKIVLSDPRRLGRVRLAEDPEAYLEEKGIGPDVLEDPPSLRSVEEILYSRRAPVKALLMDQRFFAGVGNWVADEVLYQARIAPTRPAGELTRAEIRRLRDKILYVCRIAVRENADPRRYPASWLFQHRWGKRESAKVRGHRISHITVGGRTTAWVPDLQR